jgi:CSLREA domain-containing protein
MPQSKRPAPRTLSNSYSQALAAGDQMSEIRSQRSDVSTSGSGPVSRMIDIRVHQAASAVRDAAASFRASVSHVPETVSVLPDTVSVLPETVSVLPETVSVLPETVSVLPETVSVVPETVSVLPETVNVLPETVSVLPETVSVLPETVNVLPETVSVLPDTVSGVPATVSGLPESVSGVPATLKGVWQPASCATFREKPNKYGQIALPTTYRMPSETYSSASAPGFVRLKALFVLCALVLTLCTLPFAGRAAGERFPWPASLAKIFGSRSAVPLAPPVAGTKTICPSGCDYATLTAAISDINTNGGATGAIILELGSTYVSTSETFPIVPKITGASVSNTITIRPAIGATSLLIQTFAAQAINLDGATFVTIDGRPGGSGTAKELTIDNTSTAGQAIQFINDASNNTIEYCTVKGINTSTNSGVIVFSTTTGATGNDSNTVDNCDVRDGTITPTNGIFAQGTASKANDHNTVSNCNIFNFFNANVTTGGILILSNNTDWTLSGNSLFQQTSRTYTTANTHNGILINTAGGAGNNFSITGNFVGGTSASATGTAWTIAGSVANKFVGINLDVGTATATSVQNNTVANFSLTTSSGSGSGSGVWAAINVTGGNVNVGTTGGNIVGSGTGTSSITTSTTAATGGSLTVGINASGGGTISISNNVIGSITATGSTTGRSASSTGIQVGSGTYTISGNTIGSTSTANSINSSTASTENTNGQAVNGIVSSSSGTVSITNNTIANLNNAYVGTNQAGLTRGVAVSAGTNTITGNTIRNLATSAAHGGTQGAAGPVQGISDTSSVAGQTISQNTIHSVTANYVVVGMFCSWANSTTNTISRNFIHSLNIPTPSAGLSIIGIRIWVGTATFSNNMVRLGVDASGNSITFPIAIYGILKQDTTPACNAYFNAVFIGGSGVTNAATGNTYAFARGGVPTSGTDDIRNNIFVNARSNGTGISKHYAYGMFTSAASVTSDYNLYFANGTGGVLGSLGGSDKLTLADIQSSTGGDTHSLNSDPLFKTPNGTSSTVDLHVSNTSPAGNAGVQIAGITNDFDNDTRNNPPDIGADEFTSAPSITKTFLTSPISVGGTSVLRLTVTNSNPNSLTGVAFSDPLPAGLTAPDASSSQCGGTLSVAANVISLSGATVAANSTCISDVTVTGTTTGTKTNTTGNVSSANGGTGNFATAQITVNDTAAPTISYTAFSNTGSTANRTLSVTVTDADSGVPTSGTGLPVIYYRKGSSGAYASSQCSFVSGSNYDCTLDNSLVTGGSVTGGDTIQYFVVAQDNAATPNVISNPSTGASGFTANPPAASTPPTTPSTYAISSIISGQVLTPGGLAAIGSGRTINLLKNGALAGSSPTDVSGNYSISGLTLASGDQIAVYISGAAEKGATITLSGAGSINNLNIWQNSLIVRSDNGGAISNDNLRTAGGFSPDADLTAVRNVDGSNVLSVPSTASLLIWLGTNYAPGADINDGGDWINNGTFTAGLNTVTFNGTNNQTIKGLSSTTFNGLLIWNTGTSPNNVVSLDGSLGAINTFVKTLEIKTGVLDQGFEATSVDLLINGIGQCVIVRPNATWWNRGRGDETLSCNVLNEGTIDFNGKGSSCPDDDEILIRSADSPTQHTWEGTGTFSMTDVDVQDQKVPGGATLPLQILVNSGTNSGNNTGWTFPLISTCTGPYTWIGGVGQRWGDSVNWSPVRGNPTTSDVLVFDGSVTPAPVVEDVPTETDAAIHLQNGADVTLHANLLGTATLTLANTGNALEVPANTILRLRGSRPIVIQLTALTAGGTVPAGHVAGQIIMTDDKHQLIGDNAGEIIFNGANALTIDSTYSATTHPFGDGTSGSVIFESPAVAVFSSGLDPFGGVGESVVTFNSGSTARFTSTTAFFGDGGTYGNLILGGVNQGYFQAGANPITIQNNFTLGIGNTFVFSSTPGADMNLFGNFTDETVSANALQTNGRTVKFQGATQTIFSAGTQGTFSDVSIASGTVQLLSPTRIVGQLNLTAASSLLELNGKTLELFGTIAPASAGNLKGDASATLVVGNSASGDLGTVKFLTGGRILKSLQLNHSPGSMTLGTDLALAGSPIAGTLTLTNGILYTDTNTLSLSPATSVSRSNGYVIGNLQKDFGASGTGSFTFPLGTANAYSPLDANVTANTNGTLTAKAIQGKQPNISGLNALQRYWTLSSTGTITANLTFHYSTSPINDVVGTESNYKIFKYESGSFTPFTPDATGSPSASDHFATVNNISSFSDWTLAETSALNLPTLGTYSDASVALSGNATIPPSAAPTNTTSINVSTSTDFKGTLAADPATAIVRITDAHPAGIYPVTVTAFGPSGTTTATFNLTVQQGTACGGVPAFTNAADVNVGLNAQSVAIGDFNNDGQQDLAVANLGLDSVAIRIGDGLGGFSGTTTVGLGSDAHPISVAVGDFNNDGKQDLAVANADTHNVSILLGDGSGGFSATTPVPFADNLHAVAVGDFNHDGKQDLAVVRPSTDKVSIRLGDGLGGFSGTTDITVGGTPRSVAVGDFNNDGKQDLAVTNLNGFSVPLNAYTVSILLGDGSGGFSRTDVSVGANQPDAIRIGDFNNDGKQDLAIANSLTTSVTILLGDNSGGFTASPNISVGNNPISIAVGDFDNDGNQDFATANAGSTSVSVRFGDGSGGSSRGTEVNLPGHSFAVAIGDFNNDGKQDFAATNNDLSNLSIRLGACFPFLQFSAANYTTSEDNGTHTVTVTVTRTGSNTGAVSVHYATSDGSATLLDNDYDAASDTLNWADGDSTNRTFTVTIRGDNKVEADETINLTLNMPGNAVLGSPSSSTVTITNDDTDVSVAVAPSDTAEDGAGNLVYTFTRVGVTSAPLTANFTIGGTATFSTDYTQSGAATFVPPDGTVTFTAGNSTATVTIDPTPDSTVEPDETVILTVAAGTGYNVAAVNSSANATITNDDTDVSVAVAPLSVAEDGATNLVYTFTRVGVTSAPLTVNFTIGGTATFSTDYTQSGAASFAPPNGTVTFAGGNSTATVTIDPTADSTVEPDKTVILSVAAGTGYNVAAVSNSATGTIANDDADTDVVVDGSHNLIITDSHGGDTDDHLVLSRNGSNLFISDNNDVLNCGAGMTTVDAHTCEIDFTAITGNIQVNTLGGDDQLTVDLSGGDCIPDGGLTYDGGSQTTADKLSIVGGSQGTVTYNYTSADAGNIVMSNYGKVTYTGLEPISNSGTATDIVFNLPAGSNAATLGDDSGSGNGTSRLTGATFETTDFAEPGNSLTINRGDATDTLTVNALPDFHKSLMIGSPDPFDTITFAGKLTVTKILAAAGSVSGSGDIDTSLGFDVYNTDTSGTNVLSGVISGNGGFGKHAGGVLELSGVNTYTGPTLIADGILAVGQIENGGTPSNIGQSTNAATNLVLAQGTLEYIGSGGSTDRLFTLKLAGEIENDGSGVLNFTNPGSINTDIAAGLFTLCGQSDGTFAPVIPDAFDGLNSQPIEVQMEGGGTWTLSGAHTYTGPTTIDSGRLNINGSIKSNTTVNTSGTLGGTGSIDSSNTLTVDDGGTLAPGTSPGIINTGNVTFIGGSAFAVEIGPTAANHDQLKVTGTVNLGDAVLSPSSFSGYMPSLGDSFIIIDNDGGEAIIGQFAGLPEGTTIPDFLNSGLGATITYAYNSGNDVALTVVPAPVPEIDVQGGSPLVSIPNGANAPQASDGTDFGTVSLGNSLSHTFTILNTGNATLNLTGTPVDVTGTDFAVSVQPPSSVAASGSTKFTVIFTPTAAVTRTATISIANNDADENPYTFSIQGIGADPTCATPPAGMVAWYPGEGNGQDIKGGNDGTLPNGASFSAAKVGQGFNLNGSNQYVEVTDTAANSITGAISIDAWIKTNALSANGQVIVGKYDGTSDAATSYLLTMTPGGQIEWVVYKGDGAYFGVMTSGQVVTPGVWTHVAGTFDPSTPVTPEMKVYVNGADTLAPSLAGSSTSAFPINDSATPLRIGTAIPVGGGFTDFFNGLIDEVELFNTAISASDVTAIYDASYRGKCQTGSCGTLFGISNGDNIIYTINPATGNISNAVPVTLSGFTVFKSLSLVARPSDGVLFAVLQTDGGTRRLVTVNPNTGVATNIGVLSNAIASLAFRADGTLWAVSGDGGSPKETLYTVDTSTAVLTPQFALGNGADGETIVFHPNGLMYHSSGGTTALFESVNVDTQLVTSIGSASGEMFAMGYSPTNGGLYGSDIDNNFFTIDKGTGARTPVGSIDSVAPNRGLAFISNGCPPLVQFAQANTNDTETNSGTHTVNVVVTLSGVNTSGVDVTYTVSDGTATTLNNDYSIVPASGPLHWNAGDTTPRNIPITVNGDTTPEGNETVNLALSSPSGANLGLPGSATLTILDDDAPSSFSISNATKIEGQTGTTLLTFTVTKTSGAAASVDFETQNGTATVADGDYLAASDNLSFNASDISKEITVTVNGDTNYEANETLTVHLLNPTNGATISDADGVGTIQNDDLPPATAQTFTVTNTSDIDNGACVPALCSLRDAINAANANNDTNRIEFGIPADDPNHVYYIDSCDGEADGLLFLSNTNTTTEADDDHIADSGPPPDPDWAHSWWRIMPDSNLPAIVYPVVIDGYTQTGAVENTDPTCQDGILRIELAGELINGGTGLNLQAGNSTIKGLTINRFINYDSEEEGTGQGIKITVNGGNIITGNFIGTDISGMVAGEGLEQFTGNQVGILISGVGNNTIGGPVTDSSNATLRNLISANGEEGIEIEGGTANGNKIQGNFIGTDAHGIAIFDLSGYPLPMGNTVGISIYDGANNVVGNSELAGPAVLGAGNVISGNYFIGVELASGLSGPSNNGIGSNYIGTDLTGTLALGTLAGDGVQLCADSHNNLVGGSTTDYSNIIAYNEANGVNLLSSALTGNTIRLNSIFNNGYLGIDINDDDVTPNDEAPVPDSDGGPNNRQNFPHVDLAETNNGSSAISGHLISTPSRSFKIDIYDNLFCDSDPNGDDSAGSNGEGQTYLGTANVTTDANGSGTFLLTLGSALTGGHSITATATDLVTGDTSEFSGCAGVTGASATVQFAQANTNDNETNSGTHTVNIAVSRTGSTVGAVDVNYAVTDGTAMTIDADYSITSATGTLHWNDGDGTDKNITITVVGDMKNEPNETVNLALSAPVGATLGSQSTATLTIVNDDSVPTITINDVALPEGSGGGTTPFTFTVTLSNPNSTAISVTYQTADNTAMVSDYSSASGTLTIPANTTSGQITVQVTADTTPESDETFFVNLTATDIGSITDSQGVGTIQDDDTNPTISGHVDYCITPADNVPNVSIKVTGSQTTSTTTDASGNYSINLPAAGTYTLTPTKTALAPLAPGIDTADVIGAQRHFLNLSTLSGCPLTAANANPTQDATVDTVDVIAIQQFFLGASSGTADVGKWQFNPASKDYPNLTTSQTSQDYSALVIGDITGDVTPTIANRDRDSAAPPLTPSAVTTVSLPVATVSTNVTNFTQPVTTTNISAGDNLVGFQGDFDFDSSVVTFQLTPASPAGLTAVNWNVSANILGAGQFKTLRISAFSTTSTPLSGSGTLFNLNFTRVSNSVGATTQLAWQQQPNNFVFIDTGLVKQAPTNEPPGSVTVIGPTATNGEVGGQILDNAGNPVEGAAVRMSGTQNRLAITDAAGNYHFDAVETNGFYVVTPSRPNFSFSPAQRSFSQLGAHTDAVFTGTAAGAAVNPLDSTEYFVRQQYLDFLGREPDEGGFNFWVNNIESCGNDSACREVKHIDTSAAFFLSIEFQQTGYLVYRAYEAAYGDLDGTPVPLTLREFTPEAQKISKGVVVLQTGWQQKLETNKQAFISEFVQRPRFTIAYPTSMTPAQFVDKLFATAHVESTDPDYAASLALFGAASDTSNTATRAQVLRRLAENSSLTRRHFNRAFVLMEYFGYLRRDPNSGRDADFSGYSFWLDKLNAFNGNFDNAEMVKAFLASTEYHGRFLR